MTSALIYTLIPVGAAVAGAGLAVTAKPGPTLTSAVQHVAAGVVFAAAAGEILPSVMHGGSPWATAIGGAIGVLVMLLVKQLETIVKGPVGLMTMVAVDVLIDGLVLGIAFVAGAKVGLLLTIALTMEVLFLGVTVANELGEVMRSRLKIVAIVAALLLLLPVGALLATPVATFPPVVVTAIFAFGLIALLYLVTEELLVEAHETPDKPWVTAMFFAGFLILMIIEEVMG